MFWCKLITNNPIFAYSKDFMQNIEHYTSSDKFHQDGRVVKALDLSSNGRMSAWVRSPLLVKQDFRHIKPKIWEIYVTAVHTFMLEYHGGRVDRAFY